jgi:hypothetical protein
VYLSSSCLDAAGGFNVPLQILIEHLLFGLQPVFESMAVLSAMFLVQSVCPFRDTRMNNLELFIKLVTTRVLVAP